MATPNKKLLKYAEDLALMLDNGKAIAEGMQAVINDLPDIRRCGYEDVEKLMHVLLEKMNQLNERSRRHMESLYQAGGAYQMALALGEEKIAGKTSPEDYTINTSLLNNAPRLTPKVGYEEAMKRLNRLTPKDGDHGKITIRQLNGCLGFRASEAHCVEFWNVAEPEDKKRPAIVTKGLLNILSADGTIFFFHAKDFVKSLYKNYYLPLIKGEVKAISNHKGKVVRFLKG